MERGESTLNGAYILSLALTRKARELKEEILTRHVRFNDAFASKDKYFKAEKLAGRKCETDTVLHELAWSVRQLSILKNTKELRANMIVSPSKCQFVILSKSCQFDYENLTNCMSILISILSSV